MSQQLVVLVEQRELQAARAGIDDEDAHCRLAVRPGPVAHLGRILAFGARVGAAAEPLVDHPLAQLGGVRAECRDAVDHVDDEVETVEIVEHDHVERRRRRALLLVAAHVDVVVVRAPVGEPVDQPRVAVVGEHDRPVGREERVELLIGEPVRMLAVGLQPHQVDDVDDPHLQFGQLAPDHVDRGERLQRGDVAAAGHDDVRIAVVVRCPIPDPEPARAVQDRIVDRQVVERGLLAGDDHVHVVAGAQAVVGHREQAVRVGRQVDADDLRLLVDDVVDESGILVREAVVVLAPDVRAEQVVERRDRPPPGDLARHLQPLRVLVEHRVDDVDERLVTVEQPVPAGQQVALEPALALVLGEHLHHAAAGCEVVVAGEDLGVPRAVRHLEHRAQPVRGGLVGAEEAEPVAVAVDHVAQEVPEHARRLARRSSRASRPRPRTRGSRAAPGPRAAGRRWRAGSRSSAGSSSAASAASSGPAPRARRTAPGPVAAQPVLELGEVLRVRPHLGQRHLVRAPGALGRQAVDDLWARSSPSVCAARSSASAALRPSLDAGRVLDRRRSARRPVEHAGHPLVHGGGVVSVDPVDGVAVALEQTRSAPRRRSGRAPSGWRSCTRSGAGSAVPPRRRPGPGTCSSASPSRAGPVSASPSPTMQQTSRSGLSNAAP